MVGSKSISKAEEKALAGQNESQDSQQVLDAFKAQYGVGFLSSSPPRGEEIKVYGRRPRRTPISDVAHDATHANYKPKERVRITPEAVAGIAKGRLEESADIQRSSSRSKPASSNATGYGNLDAPQPEPQELRVEGSPDPLERSNAQAPTRAASPLGDTMDLSQSPTQINNDRNYDEYYANTSQDHSIVDGGTQSTSHEHRTLNESEIGAVHFNFDDFHTTHLTESSHADGSVPGQSFARPQNLASQSQDASSAFPPETPAPPRNPFAARRQSSLLPPSQLFGGTQFSSAVRAIASPTSSRPSPDDLQQNSISPNPISSPLKTRGARFTQSPSSVASTPYVPPSTSPRRSAKESEIAETPSVAPPRKRSVPEPMSTYESVRSSQQRRETADLASETDESEDDEEDEEERRRRKVHLRRKGAEQQMGTISATRPIKVDEIEVPSTSKKVRPNLATASRYAAPASEIDLSEGGESVKGDLVADSQEQQSRTLTVEVLDAESTQSDPGGRGGMDENEDEDDDAIPEIASGMAIPETSPTEERPPHVDLSSSHSPSHAADSLPSSAILATSSRIRSVRGKSAASATSAGPEITTSLLAQLTSSNSQPEASSLAKSSQQLPRLPEVTQSHHEKLMPTSSPPATNTRSKRAGRPILGVKTTPKAPSSTAPATTASSTSALSVLASTPVLSSSAAAETQNSATHPQETLSRAEADEASPADEKHIRRKALQKLPKLHTGSTENLRSSRRVARKQQQESYSTDELAKSPSTTPTFENSFRLSRNSTARLGRAMTKGEPTSREQSLRGSRLFDNMAFAISFRSKQSDESIDQFNERNDFAKLVERKIHQAGGKVLANGFDELYELPAFRRELSPATSSPSENDLQLNGAGVSTGFTALIADGHSRKVKYMQALALGLPCLAARWITTCVEKNELVDWSPYLLCAGQSAFLGDAIRSRNLTPYDASAAKLAGIVEERKKLLDGSKILLVMKKSEETKRMAYVFLARVLGASLSRVQSIEEARAKMKAMEDLGTPYDWVYIDEKVDKSELYASAKPVGGTKRKRASTGANGPAPKKIRTLSDELVIQSLILGRLIEEGEIEE